MNATLVVPCFDEAKRLPVETFVRFAESAPRIHLLFVDDGSRDGTDRLLQGVVDRRPGQCSLLRLADNRGKAEAVRAGIRETTPGVGLLGYWDADLSTPLEEIPHFIAEIESHPDCDLVLGSRVALLGRSIERSAVRHYVGRVFATCASWTLRLPVYDTQCGAKLFRDTPEMRALFDDPFLSRWCFDVELLARLIARRRQSGGRPASESVRELPLRAWRHAPGSKVRAGDFGPSLLDLWRIRRRYLSVPGSR